MANEQRYKIEYGLDGRPQRVPLIPGDHPKLDNWMGKLNREFGLDGDEEESPPAKEMSLAQREKAWKEKLEGSFQESEAVIKQQLAPTEIRGFSTEAPRENYRQEWDDNQLTFSQLDSHPSPPKQVRASE